MRGLDHRVLRKVARYRRTTAKACSRFGQERTRHAPKGRGCVRRIRVKAHAKGTRKISPSMDSPALLGTQLSPRFVMRPAAWPLYLLPLVFTSQIFRISAFQLLPKILPCQTIALRRTTRLWSNSGSSPRYPAPLLRQRTQHLLFPIPRPAFCQDLHTGTISTDPISTHHSPRSQEVRLPILPDEVACLHDLDTRTP